MKKEIIEAFVEEMNDSFNDWVEFNGCEEWQGIKSYTSVFKSLVL